jgi:hypothetical protein
MGGRGKLRTSKRVKIMPTEEDPRSTEQLIETFVNSMEIGANDMPLIHRVCGPDEPYCGVANQNWIFMYCDSVLVQEKYETLDNIYTSCDDKSIINLLETKVKDVTDPKLIELYDVVINVNKLWSRYKSPYLDLLQQKENDRIEAELDEECEQERQAQEVGQYD